MSLCRYRKNHAFAFIRIACISCAASVFGVMLGCLWIVELAADEPAVAPADEKPISYWIEELDHNQFLRRQAASLKLLTFGSEAVAPLAKATGQGRLELTERAIAVLQSLAIKQSPDDEMGAYGALTGLASAGTGSASLRARAALGLIRSERQIQAVERLTAAGVKLGYREFVIDSRSLNDDVVWIDSTWNGDVGVLRWLRWIDRVAYAVVEGSAVNAEVLEQLVRMPDLHSVVLRESKLDSDIFTPLSALPRIDELEFRYIPLDAENATKISKLPVRVQLGLIGTGLQIGPVTELKTAMPGLKVVYRQGGFLGVKCNNLTQDCQVDSVVQGGAAEKAGLMPGDVIEMIDGVPIARFEDLQMQIGQHVPGDQVEIKFDRRGEKLSAQVTLQRMSAE